YDQRHHQEIMRRRTFLRLGAAGLVGGLASPVIAAEPLWVDTRETNVFESFGDEILTVGSSLRTIDPTSGTERRSARLRRPSGAEGPARLIASPLIAFGWYVWYEGVDIVCVNPQSFQIRWQRRVRITEEEREGGVPMVFPLVRPDGFFVLIAHKH